jgi:glycosyltransferase involved in cell wall biosynthesis
VRIAYIAAGAGSMYCGACHRDAALFAALAAAGHELLAVPLYTPLRTDVPLACSTSAIFMGGVSLYLSETLSLFNHLPAAVRRQFDRPALLRGVSRLAVQTAPAKLGRLTVSVLAGVDGPHAAEIERLTQFLRHEARPDIVNLSNSLLASLAGPIRQKVGVPIVSTLQGEESFIDALPEPHRTQAIALLRQHAASIDRFICCGRDQVPAMSAWLGVPADRLAAIPTGMDHRPFAPLAPRVPRTTGPAVLGYLSSIRREKGLDLLIESLRQMVQTHGRDVRLAIAGQILDRAYWRQVQRTIRTAGLQDRVTYHGVPDLPGKVAFLRECDIFVMPTRLPESRALAAMEALAAGVPVVASRLGVLPELLDQTGGGLTVTAEDSDALSRGIMSLADNAELARTYSQNGPPAIARHYSPQAMAQRTVAEYHSLLNARAPDANAS